MKRPMTTSTMNATLLTSLIIVFLHCHVVTAKVALADQILKDESGVDMPCNMTNGPWCDDEIYSKCMDNPDQTVVGSKVCACDPEDEHISKHEDGKKSYCIKLLGLGAKCNATAANMQCNEENTVCVEQIWGFAMTERCQCKTGMAAMRVGPVAEPSAKYKCGRKISGDECTACEQGEGTCFEYFEGKERKIQCHCPGSTSGENCQVKHATVKCTGETMFVCYNPHPGYNLTTGSWFEVDGMGYSHLPCRGVVVGDDDSICKKGESKLAIPMSDEGRKVCGTTKAKYDDTWVRYTNDLAAHKTAENDVMDDVIVFTTYCMIQSHASGTMGSISYAAGTASRGTAGDTTFPALSLFIEDVLGENIGPTQTVRSGDKVKIVFSLDVSSGYGSFVIEACLFSTHADYLRQDAIRQQVITNRCPSPDQDVITKANMFKPMSTGVQETGFVVMKPLIAGVTTYLHCKVTACLSGDEAKCPEADCSSARRRRAASDDSSDVTNKVKDITISQTITIISPKSKGLSFNQIIANKGTFITAICVILLVVVIVIVIVVVCAVRYWLRRQVDNNKLIASNHTSGMPPPPYEPTRQAGRPNPGFVPDQMRSYASQSVM